ncbi:MAG: TolC family protein [Deltaproteobacteria bacterium]|jgi:outer membrane protein TolC|nr:TolC family protein [Deltaproteobacteria bacterium]MBT4525456.1 TolC family protein [Deltaproteobacteria bacterium]
MEKVLFQKIKKIILFSFLSFFYLSTANFLFGQSNSIDPDLLKNFQFSEQDGQKVVKVNMSAILALTLDRAPTMEIIAIDQQVAQEALAANKEIYNPKLVNSVGLGKTISKTGSDLDDQYRSSPYLSLSNTNTTTLSTSWQQMIDNGIQYSLTLSDTQSETTTGSVADKGSSVEGWESGSDQIHSGNLTAAVSIPLYQGWGDINKLAEFKSTIGLEQTQLGNKKQTLSLLSTIAGIYWDLVGVLKTIETLESSVVLSQQFLEDNKVRYDLGLLDIVEVKQSESQLARAKQLLLAEKIAKKEIEDQIKAALNLEDFPFGYLPTEELAIHPVKQSYDELLELSFKKDPDLQILQADIKSNGLDKLAAEDANENNLDLSLQYTMNGYGESLTETTAGFSKTKMHGYYVGLTWSIPFNDKITPQKINKAALEHAKLMVNVQNRQTEIKVQLQGILRNLELAKEGIKLAEISTDLAKDLMNKETEKFKLGNSTSFRVAQVRQDLSDAQKDEIQARINYEKIYLSLLVLTDQIHQQYNI